MDNKIEISVIIPIYNAEKYLNSMLMSLSNQSIKKSYEVILIDDGSTDSSLKICENFSKKNSIFKTFHYNNAGVSVARNKGIEQAKGKYLSFVDPDDEVSRYFLEDMLKNMKYSQLVECQHTKDRQQLDLLNNEKYQVNSKKFVDFILNRKYPEYNGYVNNKLFISEIIKNNNIKFPNNIIVWEDMIFVIDYLRYCEKVTVLTDKLYFYRQRRNSVTHDEKKLKKSLESKIYVSKQVLKYSKFSYRLYKDFGYWYLRYNLAYFKHTLLDSNF